MALITQKSITDAAKTIKLTPNGLKIDTPYEYLSASAVFGKIEELSNTFKFFKGTESIIKPADTCTKIDFRF